MKLMVQANRYFAYGLELVEYNLVPKFGRDKRVIDRERAFFFSAGRKAIHKTRHQWEGRERLFDGLEFAKEERA